MYYSIWFNHDSSLLFIVSTANTTAGGNEAVSVFFAVSVTTNNFICVALFINTVYKSIGDEFTNYSSV